MSLQPKFKVSSVALGIFLLSSFLHFQAKSNDTQSPPEILVLGVAQVIELAQKQNLDVAIAEVQIDQTKGIYAASYSDLLPSIRGQYSAERFNGGEIVNSGVPSNFNRTTLRPLASVDYQIQTGGKAIYGVLASKHQLERSHYAKTRVLQTAFLNSLVAYYDWLRNISAVNIAKQSLYEATQQLEISESRYQDGFATKLEVSQNKTLKADKQALLLEAMNQEQISQAALIAILNIEKNKKIVPETSRIVPVNYFIVEGLTLDDLLNIALKERPDLQELNLLIKEAKNKYGIARADLFPTIGLSSYVRGIGPSLGELDSSKQAMFNVNVDLLKNLGIGAYGNMKASKARIQEAYLNKQKQFNEVFKEVSKAYKEVSLYQQKLKVGQSKINSAQEAYTISKFRSSEGIGINLEIIQAQTELTEARLDYQTAANNYNNAQINLLHKIGKLTPDKVLSAQPTADKDRCFADEDCTPGEFTATTEPTTETSLASDTEDQQKPASEQVKQAQIVTSTQETTSSNFTKREEELSSILEQITGQEHKETLARISEKESKNIFEKSERLPKTEQQTQKLELKQENINNKPKVDFNLLASEKPVEEKIKEVHTEKKPQVTTLASVKPQNKPSVKKRKPSLIKRIWYSIKRLCSEII
jgi:outer membrane protein TolC